MDVEVFVLLLVIFVLFVVVLPILCSLHIISQRRKLRQLEAELETHRLYLIALVPEHNLFCKQVMEHQASFSWLIDTEIQSAAKYNQILQRLAELDTQVSYVISNWQNEWGSGESWKDGHRPDGSSIEDDNGLNGE